MHVNTLATHPTIVTIKSATLNAANTAPPNPVLKYPTYPQNVVTAVANTLQISRLLRRKWLHSSVPQTSTTPASSNYQQHTISPSSIQLILSYTVVTKPPTTTLNPHTNFQVALLTETYLTLTSITTSTDIE